MKQPSVTWIHFVERLLPEMVDWLDRPSAFLATAWADSTMFATLCALPRSVCAVHQSTRLPAGSKATASCSKREGRV